VTRPGDGTRVVRAGLPEAEQGTPFLPGPVFAAPFHLTGEVDTSPWAYTRYGNPTWERYEAALAELEGGEVVLFASGMAAAAALLLTGLRPGSAVAMDQDCYLNVRRLARTHLEPRGVEVRLAHHSELINAPTCTTSQRLPRRRAVPGRSASWTTRPRVRSPRRCSTSALTARSRARRSTSPATPT
jgi:hypothetical protein